MATGTGFTCCRPSRRSLRSLLRTRSEIFFTGSKAGDRSTNSTQLATHPVEFAAHIVDDVAGLEVVGQHVPGVGLDLELPRQRPRLVEPQRILDREPGGAERSDLLEENRNVEVGAP